jgi:hypothetical protein
MINNGELKFDPLWADIHPNGSLLTDEESVAMWMNLRTVSEDTYQLLVSSLIDDVLQRMQQTLQLTDDVVMRIASLVRVYYFGKAPFEQFPLLLSNEVGLSQDKIAVVMNFIQTEILSLKAPKKLEEDEVTVTKINSLSLQLLQALEKFPRINDQQITSGRIKIRSEKESVRGTVRNWLRAYRDSVGVRKHSAMERGQFLFQSENAKNLFAQEREKVALLLKSLDDQEAIAIDPERQEIAFPVSTTPIASPMAPPTPPVSMSMQQPILTSAIQTFAPEAMPNTMPVQEETSRISQIAPMNFQPQRDFGKPFAPKTTPTTPQIPMTPQAPKVPTPSIPTRTFNFSKSSAPSDTMTPIAPLPSQYDSFIAPLPKAVPASPSAVSSADPFQFSSGQVLPSEKQAADTQEQRQIQSLQSKPGISKSSFGLGYSSGLPASSQKKEIWGVPQALQNVVDLRSEE